MSRLCLVSCLLLSAVATAPAAADVVTDWNSIWMDCVRATGGPPTPISRAGAMVHAAIYDAVISIERTHEPYLSYVPGSRHASAEAAASQAAHDVLVHLYPGRAVTLDVALEAALRAVPNGHARRAGVRVGRQAARNVIDARRNDGSDEITPYVIGNNPGDWRPTYPDYTPPFTPNWGRVKPWTMIRADQFRPPGPLGTLDMNAALTNPHYARAFKDVVEYGARHSRKRTEYQTQTAFFWANDVDGTYKPPGHLNHIAQVLARQQGLTLIESARLFALLNIGLADAGIVAWDCKYDTNLDFWRPITGIREADTDGNPRTLADPTWEPLNAFTPPFPAYISGHATFAATAARVFAQFFGSDRITHTISTDDPLYAGGPRTYRSFSEAAVENARSRIYLGVHWQFDADDGVKAGTALGDYVASGILRPVREPALVAVRGPAATTELSLLRVHTDPVQSRFSIEFEQPTAGPARVTVLDLQGRRVAVLSEGFRQAGRWTVSWDGHRADGSRVASGIYFVRTEAAGAVASGKIVVAR